MGDNWWKYLLAFALGLTAGVVICKNHTQLRTVCTKAIGGAMDMKDAAAVKAVSFKESAEDLLAGADAQRKA